MNHSNSRRISSTTKTVLLLAALAHGPVGIEYCLRMWQSGHYQYFVLVFLFAGYFFNRSPQAYKEIRHSDLDLTSVLGLGGVFGVVTLATVLSSPFLGILSFIALVCIAIRGVLGVDALRYMSRFLWLLVFVIPLPMNLDKTLIIEFQFVASELASWILDAFGQVHFREGVLIYTPGEQFLTEEACSGVRSLFSSMSAVGIYCIYYRFSVVRTLLNLIQTILWAIVGNAIRVAVVVAVTSNSTPVLATGMGHSSFGMLIFFLIVLMVLSTDRIIHISMTSVLKPLKLTQNAATDTGAETSEPIEKPIEPDAHVERPGAGQIGVTVLQVLFVAIFIVGVHRLWVHDVVGREISRNRRLSYPSESDLPDAIGGWKLTSYEHLNRGKHRLFAEDSFIWSFENNGLVAQFSLDCPYRAWHNLAECYSGAGWKCDMEHDFDSSRAEFGQSRINMTNSVGNNGLVIFSAVDRTAAQVMPAVEFRDENRWSAEYLLNRFASSFLFRDEKIEGYSSGLPLTGFQLHAEYGGNLDSVQIESLNELFLQCRRRLIASDRFPPK